MWGVVKKGASLSVNSARVLHRSGKTARPCASLRQSAPVRASPRQSTPVCTSLLCSGARSHLEQTIFSVSAPMFQAQPGNTDSSLPWKGKVDFEAVAKLTYIARSPRPSSLSSCNGGLQILRMRANQKALSPLVRMEVL